MQDRYAVALFAHLKATTIDSALFRLDVQEATGTAVVDKHIPAVNAALEAAEPAAVTEGLPVCVPGTPAGTDAFPDPHE
jgi:hypothetical protein